MGKRTVGSGSRSMLKFYKIKTSELKAANKRKKIKQVLCMLGGFEHATQLPHGSLRNFTNMPHLTCDVKAQLFFTYNTFQKKKPGVSIDTPWANMAPPMIIL